MSRVPTAAVAASSLVLGFAAVRVGGPQWLGAVVVLAGAAWCVAREVRRTAWWRLAAVLVTGAAAFVGSHVLADVVGARPAVVLAAVALGAVTWWLVDRRRRVTEPDVERVVG